MLELVFHQYKHGLRLGVKGRGSCLFDGDVAVN